MRNHTLDIFKLTGIFIVCFLHTTWCPSLYHGYLPVEFFFIVSGYFLYKSLNKNVTFKKFARKKIKRIYIPYLLALLPYLLLAWYRTDLFGGTKNDFSHSIVINIFMFQKTGIPKIFGIDNYLNFCNPAWYLAVLIWGGFLLFILFRNRYFKQTKYMLLCISIIIYSYFLFTGKVEHWGNIGVFCLPFWRGIADMSVGCMLAMPRYSDFINYCLKNNNLKLILNIGSLIALFLAGVIIFTPNNVPVFAIPCFALIVTACVTNGFWMHDINEIKLFDKFIIPDLSLELLLLHKIIIYPVVVGMTYFGILENESLKFMIYILALLISAQIFKITVKKITSFSFANLRISNALD